MSIKLKLIDIVETRLKGRMESLSNYLNKLREYKYFESFEQREDDIYIATFLKSGTTWMQMIVYQLLTNGEMDFNHIYDVSPWLRNEAITGQDTARVNQLPSPRVFKTHDKYDMFDGESSARFIFVYREGMDVAVSLNHHRRNYNNPDETIGETMEEYFNETKDYNWFRYTKEWLANKNGLNILYVSYEELKMDAESTIKKIAAFLNVQLDDQRLARTIERSSFEFMKAHETKFGEQPKSKIVYNNFIRKGELGEGNKNLSPKQKQVFQQSFNHWVRDKQKTRFNRVS